MGQILAWADLAPSLMPSSQMDHPQFFLDAQWKVVEKGRYCPWRIFWGEPGNDGTSLLLWTPCLAGERLDLSQASLSFSAR